MVLIVDDDIRIVGLVRAPGGVGVGLAIAKNLVEAGGGRITGTSGSGRMKFRFVLPGA